MSSSFSGDPNNFLREDYILPEGEPKQQQVVLRYYLNDIASAINTKDSGLYTDEIVITGQQFYPVFGTTTAQSVTYRDVFRKVIDFGALPNAATKSVAHGITTTQNMTLTRFYATATDPAAATLNIGIPIPYVNVAAPADGVQMTIDATNINITTTTANYTAYTRCFVIVEYMMVV